jgi:hypothetical protein
MSEQLDNAAGDAPADTGQPFLSPEGIAVQLALEALYRQLPKKRQRKALAMLEGRGNDLEREGVIFRLRPPMAKDRRGLMLESGRAMLAIARRWEALS